MTTGNKLIRCAAFVAVLACAYTEIIRDSRSAVTATSSAPELDSFSEPGIAAAILKRRSDELIRAFRMRGEGERPAPDQRRKNAGSGVLREDGVRFKSYALISHVQVVDALPKGTFEWIARMKQEIAELWEITSASDLESQLLLIYQENNLWDDFLDCYLGILGRSPESMAVMAWARSALEYSRGCGRTEEVEDALQHLSRFSRNNKVRDVIKAVLEQWSPANHQNALTGTT